MCRKSVFCGTERKRKRERERHSCEETRDAIGQCVKAAIASGAGKTNRSVVCFLRVRQNESRQAADTNVVPLLAIAARSTAGGFYREKTISDKLRHDPLPNQARRRRRRPPPLRCDGGRIRTSRCVYRCVCESPKSKRPVFPGVSLDRPPPALLMPISDALLYPLITTAVTAPPLSVYLS